MSEHLPPGASYSLPTFRQPLHILYIVPYGNHTRQYPRSIAAQRHAPGNTPCRPFNLPVHQSSVLSVRSTTSILSPALKSKSPSACASKSYSATTYCAAGFGFGFNGGGGGGAFFASAAAAAPTLDPAAGGEYGGGAPEAPSEEGGGGGAFLNVDEAGERLPVEPVED